MRHGHLQLTHRSIHLYTKSVDPKNDSATRNQGQSFNHILEGGKFSSCHLILINGGNCGVSDAMHVSM